MSSISDYSSSDNPVDPPIVFGDEWVKSVGPELEKYRQYLLAIAAAEMPKDLAGKVGASDVVQETLIKGYADFSQFDGTSSKQLAAWLRKILHHHLLTLIRSYRADKRDVARECNLDSAATASSQPSPSETIALREQTEAFEAALARLDPASQLLICLRHQDDLSFAEIATRLGKTEMTARRRWARAVQELQAELQRHAGPAEQ